MKAHRRLGLDLSWARITSAFPLAVAVLALASHLPGARQTVAWWHGVAVAAVVTIALVLTYREITVASALARWVRGNLADRRPLPTRADRCPRQPSAPRAHAGQADISSRNCLTKPHGLFTTQSSGGGDAFCSMYKLNVGYWVILSPNGM